MKKIITKIASLFATKKRKIVAGVLAVTLITGGAVVISGVVSAETSPWAILLNFFGKADVTGDVYQSVLLDGGKYWLEDTRIGEPMEMEPIFGGGTFVSFHDLENRSPVDQTVILSTNYNSEEVATGITTKYYEILGFSDEKESTGTIPAVITVEDLGDKVKWTVDMDESDPEINDKVNMGMAIAVNGVVKYAIHSNDGICGGMFPTPVYPYGTFLYAPYDGTNFDWCGGGKVADLDWITATGKYKLVDNPKAKFTVTIDKEKLDAREFKWAMLLMGRTSDTYCGTKDFTATDDFNTAIVGAEIPSHGGKYTVKSGETVDFLMSSKTVGYMVGEECTATVVVKPVK